MKDPITLFTELGDRLRGFGTDPSSRAVIAAACAANGWFREGEIRRAVRALVSEMLCRERLTSWLAAYPTLYTRISSSALPAASVPDASSAACSGSESPSPAVIPIPDGPSFRPRRVLVIMAGNIPLVGFFDLLCVLVCGHRCLVKPSAKDRVLMEYLMKLLREIDPTVPVECYDGTSPVDAVIATGSDNANRYFRARYAGIPSLLRGSRQSVAVLSGRESPEQRAGLADDIWAYSGLGCRNVSLLFLPRWYELKLEMPDVNVKYKNNYIQQKALLSMQGRPFVDLGAAVLVEERSFPTALSRISCSYYDTPEEVSAWLAEHDNELQCVVTECLPHSRRAAFGRAQSPALTDYPDDCDVIAWLERLNGQKCVSLSVD